MHSPNREPGRQSLPHLTSLEFPNQTIIQYVTVSVAKRRQLLARPEIAQLLVDSWRQADHWLVGRYVVMPDHVHLFCSPARLPVTPLRNWMSFWRNLATRKWPNADEKPIWQKDFFDRQLRSGESYHQKWLYVWENPIKNGLVKNPEDWPFQGELNVLQWHEAG
jgi:putative transposase